MAHVAVPDRISPSSEGLADEFLTKQVQGGVILRDDEKESTSEEETSEDDIDSVSDEDGLAEIDDDEESLTTSISGNPGMADMISKILRKKVARRSTGPILADGPTDRQLMEKRAKRARDAKRTMEVVGEDGTIVKHILKEEEPEENKPKLSRLEKIMQNKIGRKKPNPLDKAKEKHLLRIATRGVVQLFNAVRQQQAGTQQKIKKAGGRIGHSDKIHGEIRTKDFLTTLSEQPLKTISKMDDSGEDSTDAERIEMIGDSESEVDDDGVKEEAKTEVKSETEDDEYDT